MTRRPTLLRRTVLRRTVGRVLVMTVTLTGAVLSSPAGTPSAVATPSWVEAVQSSASSPAVHHPLYLKVNGLDASGQPLVTNATAVGYSPAQVRAYLGLTGTGSGQTVAVVTAYDDPTIAADLATFDAQFGLAAPPSFTKVSQTGTTNYPVSNGTWALETALDVEWVHAVAPSAAILLVEASSSALGNLFTAIDYAAKQAAVTVITNSYGVSGEFSAEASSDAHCKLTKAVCVFASGDNGNPGGYPAYNPWVLSVGGTNLGLSSTGAVLSETAWSGSGGGVSLYEPKPAYQASLSYAKRSIPDVSYDADPATGFAVYDSTPYQTQTGWFQVGGTSAGAPQWAAVVAAADQLRKAAGKATFAAWNSTTGATPLHSAVYALTGLADVTTGSNGTCTVCSATAGYDAVTGRGSPRLGLDVALKAAP